MARIASYRHLLPCLHAFTRHFRRPLRAGAGSHRATRSLSTSCAVTFGASLPQLLRS